MAHRPRFVTLSSGNVKLFILRQPFIAFIYIVFFKSLKDPYKLYDRPTINHAVPTAFDSLKWVKFL